MISGNTGHPDRGRQPGDRGWPGQSGLPSLLPPGPHSCTTLATSALERPLRSSRSSLTPAQLTCGYPPSTAPARPAVSAPEPQLRAPLGPWRADRHAPPVSAATHNVFNPRLSSTFRSTRQHIQLIYGSGTMSGFLGYDNVQVRWEPEAETQLALGATSAHGTRCRVSGEHPFIPKSPSTCVAVSLGRSWPC